jgi:putative ABC transport system permease protein
MGVLRYKILRDLWNDKGRTMQVLLIIGIGAAALGMILGIRDMIIPMMGIMWREINPAPINLFVGPPVNDDELVILSHTDGVEQIEGLSSTTIEWRLSPEDEWQQGGLTMRADYENQQLNLLESISGDWPTDEVLSLDKMQRPFLASPVRAPFTCVLTRPNM